MANEFLHGMDMIHRVGHRIAFAALFDEPIDELINCLNLLLGNPRSFMLVFIGIVGDQGRFIDMVVRWNTIGVGDLGERAKKEEGRGPTG